MEASLSTIDKVNKDYQTKLCELLILRHFFKNSFISSDYSAPSEFGESIILSSTGKMIASTLSLQSSESYTESESKLSILDIFYSDDILVDIDKTDLLRFKNTFSNEIIKGNIRFPWIYERMLYDRFFDNFNIRPKELDNINTNLLLNDTPIGVFQLGRNIIGPLGILESEESRWLPVNSSAPLWHCNNLSCNSLHFVELTSEYDKTRLGRLVKSISEKSLPKYFEKTLRNYASDDVRIDYDLSNLPFVLINSFSKEELKELLLELINNNSYFWSKRPQNSAVSKKFSGSAEHISKNVTLNECFQLILLFKNIDIISALEDLINKNQIIIPHTEIRSSYFGYNIAGSLNLKCEVSNLGFRFISKNRGLSSLRLKHLIMSIYKDEEEIDWKLRLIEGKDFNDKFDNLLMNENPKQIVRDFLLDNPRHIKFTFDYLLIKNFYIPNDTLQEEKLINKILWKLGFNINSFPEYLLKYWNRLEHLEKVSSSMHSYNEMDKENIRSSAVNLFVSVEEILDVSLSFITWVLLSDHYGETKFEFNLENARLFMSKELSGKKITDSGPIIFDKDGKNTLYPLIQGFTILAEYCNELVSTRDIYKRNNTDIPSYVNKTDLFKFPFNHTKMVLDLSGEVYQNVYRLLKNVTLLFEQNNVASVRNRIEHKREDFPDSIEINKACNALKEIGEILEYNGICPVVYQFNGTFEDTFRRGFNSYINHKSEQINISPSSQYSLAKLPNLGDTLVIISAIRLEFSNQYLRYRYSETSEFTKMYKGYPRRMIEITN
ncbi:hypothetical protein [Psychrobacillus antarcticus]|uniref:hypothetical protein n=1 Tax=Psychrobacillus antarcticus TaxID=2879115 RepID=UPI00240867F5|nr:hypothetical protein [Psychrobacillus antarcticus]